MFKSLKTDSLEKRDAGYVRFATYMKRLGFDNCSRDDKISVLKSLNGEKFLQIMSTSNILLRGLQVLRREKKPYKGFNIVVGFNKADIAIDPPKDAYKLFLAFFERMKREITHANIEKYATALYFAIVFAHMFEDGNGRVSRNAYLLLAFDKLPNKKISSVRNGYLTMAAKDLYYVTLHNIYLAEIPEYAHNLQDYFFGEDPYGIDTHVVNLRYVAARRVLERHHLWNGEKTLSPDTFPQNLKEDFNVEYEKWKVKAYNLLIDVALAHPKRFQTNLHKALL